ncbi:hypothetical protein D3870_14960 [Noviherbaspirillum cavernae]|uniref:C-type lysozyme inhibitor domain-containing protein n=1 Tax=Noviherbaspirillum cavernae TaxID=2320862 RepID=A0A418X3U6_9BURK|nr:YbaY family lipoprotein [Noviherbaspirillum cavernae]RJG07129.1 hypothetical protein D3870_14960 [Noviherbaspirillum cavernae]
MWNPMQHVIALVAAAIAVGGCATPPAPDKSSAAPAARMPEVVTGNASYRERIALPLGAVVRVTLEDVSRADAASRLIAEQTIRPERQVPIPFSLPYDPALINAANRYAVRATISNAEGRLMWTTTQHYGVITQGNPNHADIMLQQVRGPDSATGAPPSAAGRVFTFACEGFDVTARFTQGGVTLKLPDREVVLPQVVSASGARYQKDDVLFWNKGNEALLEVGGKRYPSCKEKAAR